LRCRRIGLALIIETACIIPTMNDEAASIKCDPDPARLSPDDVTMVIAVLRVDNQVERVGNADLAFDLEICAVARHVAD
jgi:hypothetical protein